MKVSVASGATFSKAECRITATVWTTTIERGRYPRWWRRLLNRHYDGTEPPMAWLDHLGRLATDREVLTAEPYGLSFEGASELLNFCARPGLGGSISPDSPCSPGRTLLVTVRPQHREAQP